MKKISLLILILLLSFLSYKYFFTKKETHKQPKVSQPKVEEKKIKQPSKKLILTIPVERDYKKEEYVKPPAYEDNKVIKKQEDFSIDTDVNVDKDERKIDGGKIQINKKF